MTRGTTARAPRALLLLVLALACLPGCATVGDWFGPDWVAVDTATAELVELEAMADDLATRDVVFLGEIHDDPTGHALQAQLVALLAERRPELIVSLEMFERDVQPALDAYLAGELPEEDFLADARPWPRYASDYRPVVEWARRAGRPVLAANVPRHLARAVSEEGLQAVDGEPYVPTRVDVAPGAYRERFAAAMAEHAGVDEDSLQRYFAAQCLKDETMAASIAERLRGEVFVVHLNGSFHSDHALGTVERLLRRQPGLEVGLVTMRRGPRDPARLADDDREAADYVWILRD